MTLYFTPQDEEQVLNLMEAGIYNFEVKAAENTTSKKGNPMVKLTVLTWDNAGREHVIFDYIMTAYMKKLKHFCDATGLDSIYNTGKLDANHCVGKTGKFEIGVEKQEGYQPRNTVLDYVKSEKESVPSKSNDEEEFLNDAIPF